MPLKKYTDYVSIQQDTLEADLIAAQQDYLKTKMEHAVKGLSNPTQLRHKRKELAMMKTELRKRELSQFTTEQVANRSKLRFRRSVK